MSGNEKDNLSGEENVLEELKNCSGVDEGYLAFDDPAGYEDSISDEGTGAVKVLF